MKIELSKNGNRGHEMLTYCFVLFQFYDFVLLHFLRTHEVWLASLCLNSWRQNTLGA